MDEKLDWLKDVTVAQNSKVSENALIKNVVKLFTENEETRIRSKASRTVRYY